MDATYDATAIRILEADEARARFGFAVAADLAVRYPTVAPEFIERLIEACRLAGFPLEQAVRRYLDHDKSIPVSPELIEVHRELRNRKYQCSTSPA